MPLPDRLMGRNPIEKGLSLSNLLSESHNQITLFQKFKIQSWPVFCFFLMDLRNFLFLKRCIVSIGLKHDFMTLRRCDYQPAAHSTISLYRDKVFLLPVLSNCCILYALILSFSSWILEWLYLWSQQLYCVRILALFRT